MTEYASVTDANNGANAKQRVEYAYDMYDRWIKRVYDADGAGSGAAETQHFIYDGNQIVLTLDESGSPTHRYLWGPAVDQLLAEEVLIANDPEAPGEVRWMLADHLGTIRDVALLEYVDDDPVTSIAAHLSYDSFGNRLNEAAIDLFFGYTGRAQDAATKALSTLKCNWGGCRGRLPGV